MAKDTKNSQFARSHDERSISPIRQCDESPSSSLLTAVLHLLGGSVLLGHHGGLLVLPELGLLVVLDDGAAHAAPGSQAVLDHGALDVVLLAHLASLHDRHHEGGHAHAANAESETLGRGLVRVSLGLL